MLSGLVVGPRMGLISYPWLLLRWWAWGTWPFWPYAVPPWGVPPWGAYAPPAITPKAEVSDLRARAQWLKEQLDAISKRIEELEKAS